MAWAEAKAPRPPAAPPLPAPPTRPAAEVREKGPRAPAAGEGEGGHAAAGHGGVDEEAQVDGGAAGAEVPAHHGIVGVQARGTADEGLGGEERV